LRRYLHHYLQRGGRVSLSSLQHSRIAEALRKGDRASARQLLERKWRRGIDEIASALP
jgi:DNA-binding GntR family transcriptional regulator